MTETEPATTAKPDRRKAVARPRALVIALSVLVVIAGLAALARLGPLTAPGMRLIEAAVDGAKVGRLGHLHIEGLRGDVWRRFSIARLSIADSKGPWIEARNIAVQWRWPELIQSRLHVEAASADQVTVIRRPMLSPEHKPSRSNVSVRLDAAWARIELLPAFSDRRGLYDLRAAFRVERGGGASGQGAVESLLHPGDHLNLRFDLRRSKAFAVTADALEAKGGALAGMLGLDANAPFSLNASARGSAVAGAFTVNSRVGAVAPLEGSGAWNKVGGSADLHIVLAASTLLKGYQGALGPEVRARLSGARAADGYYALTLRADGQNASIAASGEADIGKQAIGPDGVMLDAAFVDSTRLIGWPKAGSLRLIGRLRGATGQWAFSGNGDLARPTDGSYALSQLSGPVRLALNDGNLTIGINAQGAGGSGQGLVAALLGARPMASTEIVRFADGRLLIRKLEIAAPGLNVSASGDRTLFGALTFRGVASISNLAVAHPGAAGLIKGAWTADQSQPGKPWSFSFDAKGARFTSGWSELDRLLGDTPALAAKGDYQADVFTIRQSSLLGAAGALDSTGLMRDDGKLDLKTVWRATGPFRIGPIEMDGNAKGGGVFGGTLGNPRADLMADFATLDLPGVPLRAAHVTLNFVTDDPNGANGRLTIAGASDYGPAKAATTFRFVGDGVDLTDVRIDSGGVLASGDVALRRGQPSSADLQLAVGPGAVLSEGKATGRVRIVDAPGGARATIAVDIANAIAANGGLAAKSFRISADGPLAHLPYRASGEGVTGSGPWRVSGSGVLDTARGNETLVFSGGGRVGRTPFDTMSPALIHLGDKASDAKAVLAVGGGHADISLTQDAGGLMAKATLSEVNLALINRDFTGRFNANLALAGRGDALAGDMEARLTGAGGRDLKGSPPVDGFIKAHLGGGVVRLDAELTNATGLQARADVTLPAEASAAPFRIAINRKRPMKGAFSIDGELGPVWNLLMGGDRSLAGQVSASGSLGGTLADPRAIGTASLRNGHFHDAGTGLKLAGLTLDARLADTNVDITQLSGTDAAAGQLSGAGRVSLERDGMSNFRLDLKRFRLIDNDTAQATATGQITASRGADGRVKLAGALAIDRAQISAKPPIATGVVPMDVIEIHRPLEFDQRFAAGPGGASPVDLDVGLRAPGGIFLKGRGLDLELSLDAHVGGTTATATLTGVARVVRGDYDFAGKRFTIDDRGVIVLNAAADAIRLDLTAIREDTSITAVIRIQGTAAKPRITLTSTPALPTDEVLSQVLFGSSASGLSPVQGAQLASALSTLAGGGGFDIMGGLRNFTHLDRLDFAGSALTGNTVSGGKYLRENLYLELTGGDREGAAAQLEWRARKHLSVISRLGTATGDSSLIVRWRKDY